MSRYIQLALASIGSTVGAFDTNLNSALNTARKAAKKHAAVVGLPEMHFSGYPIADLAVRLDYIEGETQAFLKFVSESRDIDPQAIYAVGVAIGFGGFVYNCSAVVQNGEILGIVPKQKLPTYSVFEEDRTLTRGFPGQYREIRLLNWSKKIPFGDLIFQFPSLILSVETCEDMWSADGPIRHRVYEGAELVLNSSASPWRGCAPDSRRGIVATRSSDYVCTMAYVNKRGGQDGLVFDGGSFVFQNGRMLMESARVKPGEYRFAKDVISYQIVDLDPMLSDRRANTTWKFDALKYQQGPQLTKVIECEQDVRLAKSLEEHPTWRNIFLPAARRADPTQEYLRDIVAAQVTGLEGYMEGVGFPRVHIGLSGGKDSALCLLYAWIYSMQKAKDEGVSDLRNYMRDKIHCYSMPTQYNSKLTREIAKGLAEELGVTFSEVPLDAVIKEKTLVLQQFTGVDEIPKLAGENLQAVERGGLMVDISNVLPGLLIQTGNMSEKATGYTSIGGDILGGFSLLGNAPKSLIAEYLLQYIYKRFPFPTLGILINSTSSAELADNQTDERDLMPFKVLDTVYYLFVGDRLSAVDTYTRIRQRFSERHLREMAPWYEHGMLKEWLRFFLLRYQRSVYKWVVSPLAVHLGSLDLDREGGGLRWPVVISDKWLQAQIKLLDELPE